MSDRICLIVDDEPVIRNFLGAILNQHFRIIEAANASQAFKVVEALNGELDLIVTDISMPGDMNGVDLAFAVRTAFPNIAIVIISGYALPGSTEGHCSDCEFLAKPFRAEAILLAAERAMILINKRDGVGQTKPKNAS